MPLDSLRNHSLCDLELPVILHSQTILQENMQNHVCSVI